MQVWRRVAALAALALGATALIGCSAPSSAAEKITLKYAFFAPAASFPAVQMAEWARLVEERTGGRVEVQLFTGGILLGSGDIYEGTRQGIVEVGLDSPAYDTSRFPLSSVITVPMGLTDPVVSSRTFLDLLLEFTPAEYKDFEIVTAFTTEASYLQTLAPVDERGDLNGMTLRGTGATIPTLTQLGANPVSLPMSDVTEQLGTNVIDGYSSSREVLKDFGLAETVKYVTDYPLGISNSFVAVMDKKRFEKLPADVQKVIVGLREEMSQFAGEVHSQGIQKSLELAETQGVKILDVSPDDIASWNKILEDRADAWVRDHANAPFDARAVIDRAKEIAASYQTGQEK